MNKKPTTMICHLKEYRKKQRLTLQQLADQTGLSASYISKIERGIVVPSAEAIQDLSYALHITANELMTAAEDVSSQACPAEGGADVSLPNPETLLKSYAITPEDRSLIYSFGDTLSFESILEENPHFKVNVLTFPGVSKDSMRSIHSYDEFGIVARGTLELILDDEHAYTLQEGDCIMIRAQTRHASRSLSPDGCVSYWIEILPD